MPEILEAPPAKTLVRDKPEEEEGLDGGANTNEGKIDYAVEPLVELPEFGGALDHYYGPQFKEGAQHNLIELRGRVGLGEAIVGDEEVGNCAGEVLRGYCNGHDGERRDHANRYSHHAQVIVGLADARHRHSNVRRACNLVLGDRVMGLQEDRVDSTDLILHWDAPWHAVGEPEQTEVGDVSGEVVKLHICAEHAAVHALSSHDVARRRTVDVGVVLRHLDLVRVHGEIRHTQPERWVAQVEFGARPSFAGHHVLEPRPAPLYHDAQRRAEGADFGDGRDVVQHKADAYAVWVKRTLRCVEALVRLVRDEVINDMRAQTRLRAVTPINVTQQPIGTL
eukprot:scaffold260260_cov31-Tisochrysis_lutea.AAC.1